MLYTTTTKLNDSDGDGIIVIYSAKTTPQAAKGTNLRYLGVYEGKHYYTDANDTLPQPEPEPEPEPLPISATSASRNINFGPNVLFGVNISGAEFSGTSGGLIPSATRALAYVQKGFNLIRMPFKMTMLGASQANMDKFVATVNALTNAGAYVILDRHEYGTTMNASHVAFWHEFLPKFANQQLIIVDFMNEPKSGKSYQPDATTGLSYATDVNECIAEFRNQGHQNIVMVEWRGSSGIVRFDKEESGTKVAESPARSFDLAGGLVDPLGKTVISPHGYPDSDSSGTSATCGETRYTGNWIGNTINGARERGLKAIIGEMAFGRYDGYGPFCESAATGTIAKIKENSDVFVGVTWWGGGPAWGHSYIYRIEQTDGTFATAPATAYVNTLLGN